METSSPEHALLSWFGRINYSLMDWTNHYWWPVLAGMVFVGCLIGMAPLSTHHEQPFHQIIFVWVRKIIIWASVIMAALPFVMLYLYDVTTQKQLADSQYVWLSWFTNLAKMNWFTLIAAAASGGTLRFMYKRYALPGASALLRRFRNIQTSDTPTDIRDEANRFKVKDFLPSKHYKKDFVFIGLDEKSKPIMVPSSTWYETNMQIIGPTRYGKGVIIGAIMDQAIRNGDCLFYIDPKMDRFAPHVMYQACKAAGRKFYYVTLHDNGIGKWAPFAGGTDRDGLSRMETAFGLDFTGDPGTDYYKSQERKELERAFAKTRNIDGLKKLMEDTDANRINAELARWSSVESLCPKKGGGFSIEKALTEGAVVYVQGSLDDSVVKTATKIFIAELIQEARRLEKQRKTHLTAAIDEVSFLASKTLAQALATAVGFRVNFVLAYQSQDDLLNLDDKSVNPKYVHHSINVNSQIKAVHGGADFDTAEWAANLSGTVVKEITKMEKTDVSGSGGETWENQRFIGTQEENFINTNMVLTLPPRVCVFVQPRHLASICFSSFVPVKDMTALDEYLNHKEKVYSSPASPSEPTNNAASETPGIESVPEELTQQKTKGESPISQAKPDNEDSVKEETQPLKIAGIVLPFRSKKDSIKQSEKKSETKNEASAGSINNPEFFEDQQNANNSKDSSNPKKPSSPKKKSETAEPEPSSKKPSLQSPPGQDKKPTPETETPVDSGEEDLAAKKRERNRIRKAKQKAKKQAEAEAANKKETKQSDSETSSKAKPQEASTPDEPSSDKNEISDEFAAEFASLSLKSDDKTMSILDDLDEDDDK